MLFKAGDPTALYGRIKFITDNPSCIEKFKKNTPGVKSIEENSQELEKIYSQISEGEILQHSTGITKI